MARQLAASCPCQGSGLTVVWAWWQGSLLQYARGMAQAAAARQAIVDCVLVVPAFWGPPQRQAYIDAAKLAGGLASCCHVPTTPLVKDATACTAQLSLLAGVL